MDPQSIAIGLAVCVLSAIIIYLITAFTMKEKTFDEVLEEQRRRQEEEKPKSKKKNNTDVSKKKVKKEAVVVKEKGKKAEVQAKKETKMVNLEIDPEIIQLEESVVVHAKKSKKTKSQKPILVNKNEHSLITEKTAEVYHKEQFAPKDEIALKHKHEEEKPVEDASIFKVKKKTETKKERGTKIETIEVEVEKAVKSEKKTELNKEKPRGKTSDKIKNSQETTSCSPLINSVKNATLNDVDIQSLIDILLNKQGGSIDVNSEWNKKSQKGQKGDGLSLLKQQLEDKERALQQEQQLAMSSNNKVKEIRQDLNAEKAKYAALEKAYKEKLDVQNNEMTALHARLAHIHEKHASELNNLQVRLRQSESSTDRNMQKLTEENKILQDTLSNLTKTKTDTVSQAEFSSIRQKANIMEKELNSNAVKLTASENNRKIQESKIAKYEEQIRQFESGHKDTEAIMNKKMDEVNKELRRADQKNTTLNNDLKKASADLQKANGALKSAENECSSLKKQLQELNTHLSAADVTKELEGKLQQANRKSSELEGNVKNLEKQLSDSNQRYSELKKEIEVMRHENMALAEEMKTTKERQAGEGQEAAPNAPSGAPNGDIHNEHTVDKNLIKLEEHESILAEKVKELTRLTAELANQKSEVGNLQEQLETQKKKNNEKASNLSREVESLDKGVLQRLFPSISVNEKLGHKEWMTSFEKQANTYVVNLSQQSSSSANKDNRIKQLEDTNNKLSTQTRDLQKIIDDTENKLKQLQKSVDSEEKKWKEKLEKALSSKSTESDSQVKDLEAQVTQYRNVLSSTEDKLLQLSEKVESEEKSWKATLQSTQTELENTKKELSKLKDEMRKQKGSTEELNDLDFAYRCVEKSLPGIIDEMETKVVVLESELKTSESERNLLQIEVKEAKSQVLSLEKQIETSSQISIENEEYKRLYESEKKKTKDLSTNVVKLTGIIKTGQDALSQEQKLVKQLQDELEDQKKGSTDGKSISTLRSQLASKDKQLEREISSNKHLTQKLAQLGVMAASPANDSGTSV
ncbi:ribosome-binding protein 1 isoform X4 [Patella vulgata]|uniref:ribosome-binding protein 1 isoform X4 n=1 Tax=Patella vulgata TaxID=6465 RepID=UPI0024A7EEC4|nr:ribosome-binding protein 1 isoform X4 [Patella vulgata]